MSSLRAGLNGLALSLLVASPSVASAPSPSGGANFWCAFFQSVKLVSLVTGNVEGVVVGAIGGGLSCGMGW